MQDIDHNKRWLKAQAALVNTTAECQRLASDGKWLEVERQLRGMVIDLGKLLLEEKNDLTVTEKRDWPPVKRVPNPPPPPKG